MLVTKGDRYSHIREYVPISFAQNHDRGGPYRFDFSGFVEFDNTSKYQ